MKKAQAGMEFLMTYGWAMMVGALVIVGMSYFGLFNLDTYLPFRCDFPTGFSCKDFSVLESSVQISLKNNLGGRIDRIRIDIPDCTAGTLVSLKNDETNTISFPGCTIPKGKFNFDVRLSYTKNNTGLFYNTTGTLSGKKN